MNSNKLQLEFIGGNCMDKVTMVKKEVQLQNWSETIIPYFISNLYCLSVFQGSPEKNKYHSENSYAL